MRDVDSRDVEVVRRFSAITYKTIRSTVSYREEISPYVIVV